jgi:hypothetical protein
VTSPEFAELRGLLDALCEETITAEQMQRLETLLRTHPAAEAYYVQYMSLYAGLARHFAGPEGAAAQSLRDRLGAPPGTPAPATLATKAVPSRRRRWLFTSGFLAAMAGVAASILWLLAWWRPPQHTQTPSVHERVDDTVAVLLQAHGAEWEASDLPTRPGSPLRPGLLRLKSGFAHLEFYSGATVLLEGPAEFRILSATRAYCERGKLRAMVPAQAQGFTIGSPRLDLVDRGTEFGLQVGADNRTEVHVFQGKVELHDAANGPDAPAQQLTTGQSVRLEEAGIVRPIQQNSAAFLTARELAARSQARSRQRQQDWVKASAAWRRDPDLKVYYTFHAGPTWDRTLRNEVGQPKDPHDGTMVGATWVSGRWPGKQALEFKQVSDRVRFRLPGKFKSISLLAWVRVDALPNLNNSLMMSDAWKPGTMHWQIGNDGKLILGVQSQPQGNGAHYHAPDAITPEHFGQWLLLGVVYDRDQVQVTHYVNGQPVASQPLVFDLPLRVGDAELGNWNMATHHNPSPVRFFTGCMDEFMLFSRALTEAEMERLYQQGRPPQ